MVKNKIKKFTFKNYWEPCLVSILLGFIRPLYNYFIGFELSFIYSFLIGVIITYGVSSYYKVSFWYIYLVRFIIATLIVLLFGAGIMLNIL